MVKEFTEKRQPDGGMPFSLQSRLKSFVYAGQGVRAVLKTEHNAWIHLALTLSAVVCGFLLEVSKLEWVSLIIVIAMVWIAELINTAVEKTIDFIALERNPLLKKIKDMAAAAVLIAAVAALLVGCVIFVPKLL
jgi:diacylglycerol kinase